MALVNPWILLVGVLLLGGVAVGSYVKGGDDRENALIAQNKHDEDIETRTFNAALTGAAVVIAKNKQNNTIIKQTLEKTIEHDYDPTCKSSPDGMRSVNDALANTASKPADSGGVPGSNPENRPVDSGRGP